MSTTLDQRLVAVLPSQRQKAILRLGPLLLHHSHLAAERLHQRLRTGYPLVRQRSRRHPSFRMERCATPHA